MGTYNSDPRVNTLATALTQDSDAKGKIYSRILQASANTADDFKALEGAADSNKPFWVENSLTAEGGDKVKLTSLSDIGGEGALGEQELTGNTSDFDIGGYEVQVDIWRDAVEITQKMRKFMAAGGDLKGALTKKLGEKMGRKRMYDMMVCLMRRAQEGWNIVRPNNRGSRDSILATDTLTPSFGVEATARLKGLGGQPLGLYKSESGSPVLKHLIFAGQDAMVEFRNSNSWQNAILHAAARGDMNPAFSGRLLDWQGFSIWEHNVVDPDVKDAIGSPIAPKAKLGVLIPTATTTVAIKMGTDTRKKYFKFFPGYDYQWVEGQSAAPDGNTYYAWIIDPAQGGKAMFISYVGSANDGNQIGAITGRLAAADSGIANDTIGSIAWNATYHTTSAGVDSWIIPANSKGTPIGTSFALGAGAALRAYGRAQAAMIEETRDFGAVQGWGRESIHGQGIRKDTQGKPRGYMLLEHAVEHPGIAIPGTYGV